MNQKRPPDLQPARDALSSAPKSRQRRPNRSDRTALGGVAAFGLAALLTLAGCPGNLEQPERFAGTGGADPNALPTCLTAMFARTCKGSSCHDKGTFTNDLDLTSSGVTARVLNVAAPHSGLDAGASCMPAKLVDTQNGLKSWIYLKLTNMQGDSTTCGESMPLGNIYPLTEAEKSCYTAYFQSLTGSAGGSGGTAASGGSAGTASTAGGTGGAATGGGGATATGGGGAATGGGGSGGATTTAGSGGSGGASGGASGSAGTGGA